MKKVLFCIAALCAAATGGFAQSFSAATYNVRQLNAGDDARGDGWERRLPVIASLIRYHDFDIFGAQEVFHSQLLDLLAALPGYARVIKQTACDAEAAVALGDAAGDTDFGA